MDRVTSEGLKTDKGAGGGRGGAGDVEDGGEGEKGGGAGGGPEDEEVGSRVCVGSGTSLLVLNTCVMGASDSLGCETLYKQESKQLVEKVVFQG